MTRRPPASDAAARAAPMQIGDLARALGVTAKTLRHYEKIGLVPPAMRTTNGYRVFSADAARRARLTVRLRGLGFSLATIANLLDERADGTLRDRLKSYLDQEISEHSLQIAVLQGRREDFEARLHALVKGPTANAECVCAALMQRCDCVR